MVFVGRIMWVDIYVVQVMFGVLLVMMYENVLCLFNGGKFVLELLVGCVLLLLQDDQVYYNGQFIVLVVGDMLEYVYVVVCMVCVEVVQQFVWFDFEIVCVDVYLFGKVQM